MMNDLAKTRLSPRGATALLASVLAAALVACGADGGSAQDQGGGGATTGGAGGGATGGGAGSATGAGGGGGGAGGDEPTTEGPTEHVNAVWAVHDGEKIERDDLAHPAKAANTAWDGHVARIFGGRNEVLALQLVVESGPAGISELRVSLPSLVQRGGPARIDYAPPGEDPTEYAGRPIQIFSEAYMRVEEPTSADWIVEPNTPAAPADMLGDKPVQLVPENATPGRGGMPLQVEPQKNQAIWIDVYVDRSLAAGVYDGTLRVETDGELRKIPLELEVLDFTLPEESSLTMMLYHEGGQVEEYQGKNLDARYHRFAHRQRVEFVDAYDQALVEAHMGRFDGADFTAKEGYGGPGEGAGNQMIPRSFWGPDDVFYDQASAWQASDAWMTFLAGTFPNARTLLYMPDEPGPAQYAEIQDLADNVHGNPGPGSALPIFVTRRYTSELDSAIDLWCSNANFYDPERAAIERSHGDDLWYYNGRRPNVGSLVIDTPATDARVHGWAAFSQDIPVYFYWHVDHWHHNQNAPDGYERVQDVWKNPMTFINDYGEYGNGDGVLVYPGTEKLHPEEDRGIEGPISTIQMANLRRGAQDHLYLTMARQCGQDALVDAALEAIVPAVFTDAGDAVSFPESGDAYETVRRSLAEALASCP